MLNWTTLKGNVAVERDKKVGEEIHGAMTSKDVDDTQHELYKLNEEMWGMIKELTIDQRRALNHQIRGYCRKCQMENMGESDKKRMAAEAVRTGITPQDMDETKNAINSVDAAIWMLIGNLTLAQRQKAYDMLWDFADQANKANANG